MANWVLVVTIYMASSLMEDRRDIRVIGPNTKDVAFVVLVAVHKLLH